MSVVNANSPKDTERDPGNPKLISEATKIQRDVTKRLQKIIHDKLWLNVAVR